MFGHIKCLLLSGLKVCIWGMWLGGEGQRAWECVHRLFLPVAQENKTNGGKCILESSCFCWGSCPCMTKESSLSILLFSIFTFSSSTSHSSSSHKSPPPYKYPTLMDKSGLTEALRRAPPSILSLSPNAGPTSRQIKFGPAMPRGQSEGRWFIQRSYSWVTCRFFWLQSLCF